MRKYDIIGQWIVCACVLCYTLRNQIHCHNCILINKICNFGPHNVCESFHIKHLSSLSFYAVSGPIQNTAALVGTAVMVHAI